MSSLWKVAMVSRCWRRSAFSDDTIMARIAEIRSGAKNMCSDRQRPMPWAPRLRLVAACSGVSAFARTCGAPVAPRARRLYRFWVAGGGRQQQQKERQQQQQVGAAAREGEKTGGSR